ncbi:MAG: hypothetical protein ABUT20_20895 [Bacteroidota bacterium]
MEESIYKGVLSFINHDKGYATIEYSQNEKKKTINFKTVDAGSLKTGTEKQLSKSHHFRTGDHVSFQLKLSDRGDRMVATAVKFLYNHELEQIINKAKVENIFKGFLKQADDTLFVKELNSYLFFPLVLSKWEKAPPEKMFNEAFDFVLLNTDKPDKMRAVLYKNDFIPEYKTAMQYWKNKTVIEAPVYKVSPYAVYLNLFGDKVQAKLSLPPEEMRLIKTGDKINVLITFLSPSKIAVEKA